VEWIVTTGRSVEEAKEMALDQLGVSEEDAEFEILEEAKPGLFGRFRKEVRVRARVQPVQPRPKVERRRKRSSAGPEAKRGASDGAPKKKRPAKKATADGPAAAGDERPARTPRSRPSTASAAETAPTADDTGDAGAKGDPVSDVEIPLSEHAALTRSFVEGLLDAFALDAQVSVQVVDDETAEVRVDGDNLGVLIGPSGNTLQAIQTLSRASVQRPRDAEFEGRVFVEVGGYRQKRKDALERFTRELVEQVVSSGVEKALEPMGSADRKVVHDTVNDCEGVRTISVGEEPRRRVVIVPESD
jgi:spoIIIJ-associated protein